MVQGQEPQTSSIIHRMDPRLKLAGFGAFLVATALLGSLAAAGVALALAFLWVILARFSLIILLRQVGAALFFLSTFFLILPFSHPGGVEAGLTQASVILLKGAAMILTIFPMFGTAPFHLSMKALTRLKLSPRFVTLILLTQRYTSVYSEELRTLRTSLRSRGFKVKADLKTLITVGDLIGSLLVRSFEQTGRIYQAMVSRGYHERFGALYEFAPPSSSDRYKLVMLILISLSLPIFDWIVRGGAL